MNHPLPIELNSSGLVHRHSDGRLENHRSMSSSPNWNTSGQYSGEPESIHSKPLPHMHHYSNEAEEIPPPPPPYSSNSTPRHVEEDGSVSSRPSCDTKPAADFTMKETDEAAAGQRTETEIDVEAAAATVGVPIHKLSASEAVTRQTILAHHGTLRRALSWWSLMSMGVGATIGAGIFVMVGIVAHTLTGPALPLSFVVAAIACVFTGLCYAEFASIAPSAGSAYAYTRATMGQFLAWMLGWDLILEYTVSAAAVAQSWSQYLNEFLALFSARIPTIISKPPFDFDNSTGSVSRSGGIFDLPAFIISILITILLVCGVRDSARFNNVMVGIKVSIVLFVIVLGATLVDPTNWHPFAPFGYLGLSFFGHNVTSQGGTTQDGNATGVLAGAAIVFFAYIGFDSVSCQAEEVKKPERDVPIAIIGSLTISTLLYVGVSIVLTGMVPYHLIDVSAPLSTAFTQRGYHWAGYLVAIGAVVGITSVLLVTMLSQPRIFMAMARDGLLPPFFAAVHPRFQTPWKATILTGVCVSLISSLIPLSILVEFVSIGTLMAFAFVCVSIIVLRYTSPELHRPFRCPWVPLIPILGVLCCLLLMFSLPANNWYRLISWFAIGCVIYFFYGRKYGIGDQHHIMTRAYMDGLHRDPDTSNVQLVAIPIQSLTSGQPPDQVPVLTAADQSSAQHPQQSRPRTLSESIMAKPVQIYMRQDYERGGSEVEREEAAASDPTAPTATNSAEQSSVQMLDGPLTGMITDYRYRDHSDSILSTPVPIEEYKQDGPTAPRERID